MQQAIYISAPYYIAPTYSDSIVSSSGSSQSVPCQVTQVCQMQLMRRRKSVVNQQNLFKNILYSNSETTCFGL